MSGAGTAAVAWPGPPSGATAAIAAPRAATRTTPIARALTRLTLCGAGTKQRPVHSRLTGQSMPLASGTGPLRGDRMRAAAVQLNSTNEKDRNLASADELV